MNFGVCRTQSPALNQTVLQHSIIFNLRPELAVFIFVNQSASYDLDILVYVYNFDRKSSIYVLWHILTVMFVSCAF